MRSFNTNFYRLLFTLDPSCFESEREKARTSREHYELEHDEMPIDFYDFMHSQQWMNVRHDQFQTHTESYSHTHIAHRTNTHSNRGTLCSIVVMGLWNYQFNFVPATVAPTPVPGMVTMFFHSFLLFSPYSFSFSFSFPIFRTLNLTLRVLYTRTPCFVRLFVGSLTRLS